MILSRAGFLATSATLPRHKHQFDAPITRMESSSPPARFRVARTACFRSTCPFLPTGVRRATWRKPHSPSDISHVWQAVFDLRPESAEATVETPHPHRISAAGNSRLPLQFGHNGTLSAYGATAATVRFDARTDPARPCADGCDTRLFGDSLQPVQSLRTKSGS